MNNEHEKGEMNKPQIGIDKRGRGFFKNTSFTEVLDNLGLKKDDIISGRVSARLITEIIRARIGGRRFPSRDTKDGRE
jgi:hypothetical protein